MNYKKKYVKYKLKYLNLNKNIYLGEYSNITQSNRELNNMLQNVDNWWQQQDQIYNNIEQTNDNDAEQTNNNDTEQTNDNHTGQEDDNETIVDYFLNSIAIWLTSMVVYELYERFS